MRGDASRGRDLTVICHELETGYRHDQQSCRRRLGSPHHRPFGAEQASCPHPMP